MSKLTNFLKLFKYTQEDRDNNVNFNVEKSLNENWDKIEQNAVKTNEMHEQQETDITKIKETLEDKADLVDGKVKAEQLPDMDYASTEHTHTIVDVTGLEDKLDNKADKEHTHEYEPAITNKGSAFNKNFGTKAGTVCQGNDSRLTDSRNAKDVYNWAKASGKPSYNYSEIKNKPSSFTPSSHSHNSSYYTKSQTYTKTQVDNKIKGGTTEPTSYVGDNCLYGVYE